MPKNYSKRAISSFYSDQKHIKPKSNKYSEPVYSLRISEDQKYANDKQWFKDYVNYIDPYDDSVKDNYEEIRTNYQVLNNDLSGFKKELDDFCNPLGENIGQIEETVVPFAKLHNHVSVLKGELLKRKDNHKIVLLSAKAIKEKDDKLIAAIKASVEETIQLKIVEMQSQMEGKSQDEIGAMIEELRTQNTPEDAANKQYKAESEIFYSKALKYCQYDQNVKAKKMDSFTDVIVADECYVYSGWSHGKPALDIRNPLYVKFFKGPNERMINKADWISYRKPITIADVYNNYPMLSDDEIESLGIHTYSSNGRVDKRHSLNPADNDFVFDHTDEHIFTDIVGNSSGDSTRSDIGLNQTQGTTSRLNHQNLIWETHTEFRAYRQIIFLSYLDEYNKKITIPMSDKFKVPKEADKIKFTNKFGEETEKFRWVENETEYTIEKLFVPRKYEVVRLGSDVYPVCREVPFQYTDIDQPYSSFNLSTFGAVFTARNAKSVSLLRRAIPTYFQFIFVKNLQNRELSKYQGAIQSIDVDQIPDELGEDVDGKEIRSKVATYLLYLKKTNKDFYSGSQSSKGNLAPATRSPGSNGFMLGTAVELMNLQSMLDLLSVEIGLAMGISPQRLSNFSDNSNVRDNRQAITQSHHITEPYFFLHDEVWKGALNDYLINFKTYVENIFLDNPDMSEHQMHYVLEDGTSEILEISRKNISSIDRVGLFLSNSGQDQLYLDAMMQLSHAFSQNAGEGIEVTSSLIKAIVQGSSPEETHKMIAMEAQKQAERLHKQQMEQAKQQAELQDKHERMIHEHREDLQRHEIEKIDRKGEWDLTIKQMDAVGQGADVNSDGIPDSLQIAQLQQKDKIENRKLDQKDKEMAFKEKELKQKKELEIKKINKPTSKT